LVRGRGGLSCAEEGGVPPPAQYPSVSPRTGVGGNPVPLPRVDLPRGRRRPANSSHALRQLLNDWRSFHSTPVARQGVGGTSLNAPETNTQVRLKSVTYRNSSACTSPHGYEFSLVNVAFDVFTRSFRSASFALTGRGTGVRALQRPRSYRDKRGSRERNGRRRAVFCKTNCKRPRVSAHQAADRLRSPAMTATPFDLEVARTAAMHQRTSEATQSSPRAKPTRNLRPCPRVPYAPAGTGNGHPRLTPRARKHRATLSASRYTCLGGLAPARRRATPCLTNLNARIHDTSSTELRTRAQN
jgi:hypothetical protein